MTDETTTSPEVMAGDVITQPGLYESRGGDIVQITGWEEGWWVSEWNGTVDWYGSDGRQRFRGALDTGRWDLLHWVRPLPANEAEPETTSEQLAEIEGQPEPVQVREGRWKTRGGGVKDVTAMPTDHDEFAPAFPWWDGVDTWKNNGRWLATNESTMDLLEYLGPIDPDKTQELPAYTPPEGWRLLEVGETLTLGDEIVQSDDGRRYPTERVGSIVVANQRYIRRIEPQPEEQPQPRPQPVQVREGRWQTRNGEIFNVTPTPECDSRAERFPWWDAAYRQTWCANGKYHFGRESSLDLVTYLGPIDPDKTQELPAFTPPDGWQLVPIGEVLNEIYIRPIEIEPEPEPEPQAADTADELRSEIHYLQKELAVAKAELTIAAAVSQQLQIELDAAQQVPADLPELRQLRLRLADMTLDRDQYKDAWNQIFTDQTTIRETTAAETVEAIIEWLQHFRGCNSPSLALLLLEALPHIIRNIVGLNTEDVE